MREAHFSQHTLHPWRGSAARMFGERGRGRWGI